jgi:predicted enzyme related to lactoylglutathione lyase
MTTVDKHQPGTFCWVELATSDLSAGREFYSKVFGWQSDARPVEGWGDYATFSVDDGRSAAGGYVQQEAERSMGVPPHWNLYITTEDVDATVAKATELGGQATVPSMDTPLGKMAVIADPTGARFCLWQSEQMPGFTVRNEPVSFAWADLITPDKDRAKEFYGGLFGWTGEDTGEEFGFYTLVKLGDEQIAGMMNPNQPETPPVWMPYFDVTDADAVTSAATEAGAQVMMPVTPIPTVGRFAVLSDPQGALFAVLQTEWRQGES